MEKRISDRGYYPVRLTRDEVDAWSADPTLVDARFKAEMLAQRRALDGARRRAPRPGKGIRCIVSPANDDMFEIDPIIERAEHVELGEANTIALDGFTLVSTGWANPTPWNTFRELPEPELRERIDGLVAEVPDPHRAIFNFHAPPYGSNLDNAPKLDADMNYVSGGQALIPVGSQRGPRGDPRVRARRCRSTATSTRARARSSSADPRGQPRQLLRGRRPPGGHRRPRRRRKAR